MESSESGFVTRLAATTGQESRQDKGEDQPGHEGEGGELGRHWVCWRRRVQVGHDEKPLPVREGSFDPRAILDAPSRRARFLVGVAEHETLVLSDRDRAVFFDALVNPPAPSERLQRAFAEHKRAHKRRVVP
jgi:hypothetical protein